MRTLRLAILGSTLAAGVSAPTPAQVPVAQVSAVPEYAAIAPGGTFRVAVRLAVPAGWHIYWVNPGASGLPTTLAWHVPPGVTAGETEWPYPETDDAGGAASNVYRGNPVVFSSFAAGPGASGPVRLMADLDYGLCRQECVQQHQTVAVSVRVGAAGSVRTPSWGDVALAERALPVRLGPGAVRAEAAGDSVRLEITGAPNVPAAGTWVTFFPLEPGRSSAVAQVHAVTGAVGLDLPKAVLSGEPLRLRGVLVPAHAPGVAPATRPLRLEVRVAK